MKVLFATTNEAKIKRYADKVRKNGNPHSMFSEIKACSVSGNKTDWPPAGLPRGRQRSASFQCRTG